MQKIVKLNRVFLYCCMVVMFCLSPLFTRSEPLQGKPLTISIKNTSLAEVLRQISKKSGLYIYFQDADLAAYSSVSIDVKNKPVDVVLHELLDGRGLSWVEVDKNSIAIRRKEVVRFLLSNDTDSLITITGRVTNEKGGPVPGATVFVKGSKIGTTTNSNGDFILNGVRPNGSLVISSISFVTQEVAFKGKSSVGNIQLHDYVGELDETVIVAYGNTTRRLNTGNVVSIKAEEIEKQPVNNPLYALQGRVAGLIVTPTTGLAGGNVSLQIRGKNSIGQASNPLIVVDGLPLVNSITGLSTDYLSTLSAISFINPNDIERIDVLKDADATSIYGSRGSNGVVLITTKKGKPGQTKIDINVQNGWAKVPKKIDLLNTQQYLTLSNEAWANSGVDFITTFPYGLPEIYKYSIAPSLTLWDQKRYTDWQKELIGKTANYFDAQGSISGGNSNISYIIGGNYHRETTVFPGKNADRKGGTHFSLTGSSDNRKFKATLTSSYQADYNTLPGIDFTNTAMTLGSNAPSIFMANGDLNWENTPTGDQSWDNPYYPLHKTYEAKLNNIITSADISYKILPTLVIKTQLGYNELRGNSFRKDYPFSGRNPTYIDIPANASFRTNGVKNLSIEPQLSYDNYFGKNKISVLIGASVQSTTTESQSILAEGFTDDAFLKNLSSATNYNLRNTSSQYKYGAFFGRFNYTFDNKYLLNITGRRDGSSRFGPGKQFGNFGSIGAAWIFTKEDFMKSALPFMTFGKLRFSYGSSGNDGIGDYQYMEKYTAINAQVPYQGARGYITSGLFNPYYAWEVTRKMEFGLETGFLNDRILLTASYFKNRSDNQLVAYPYPSQAGPGYATVNLPALIQNSGIELTLWTEVFKTNKFSWSTSINFTRNRNKLISFPNIENTGYANLEIGQPFNQAQLYSFSGVDPTTGKYQFKDVNGKLTFNPEDDTRADRGKYVRVMSDPAYYGGISNTFSYYGLSLDLFFQFTKQKGINPLASFVFAPGYTNMPVEYLSRWQKAGDVASIQKFDASFPSDLYQGINNIMQSDWKYVDASFIRLKNLSLSYSIPRFWKEKLKFKNMRIFIQGQNLWTITKYKGLDPETQSTTSLPPLRVVTVGIQITL